MRHAAGLIVFVVLAGAVPGAAAPADEPGFLGLKYEWGDDPKGAKVLELIEGGPAEKAGVKADDVVVKVDKKAFDNAEDFLAHVKGLKPGDKATLTVLRDGKEKEIAVTVGKRPADPN